MQNTKSKPFRMKSLLMLVLILSAFQTRQDPMAGEILAAVAKNYKKLAGFHAKFTHSSESNSGKLLGSKSGQISVSNQKFRLKMEQTTLICDGKTTWNANSKIKEVTISDYDPEPDDITPERIYSFYQKGYKYVFMGEVKVKGKV